MHFSAPYHETRRGSSRYRSEPGYAAADAEPDHRVRERKLDIVRAAANRRDARERGLPSAHQVVSVIADAVALLNDPSTGDPQAAKAVGRAVKRVLLARGIDPRAAGIAERFEIRLRPLTYVMEAEIRRQADLAIACARDGRAEVLDLFSMLRDDDD